MSEEVVGSIVGFLRMDADQFHREIKQAIAELAVLKGQNVKVDVKTNAKTAERELQQVTRAASGAARGVDNLGGSFGGRGLTSAPVIVGGIAAGMALLGPVTGAATAAVGGFVGVVGTGILAWQGFQAEIEKGTALGDLMQQSLDGIKGEFQALGTTAASAMSGDVLNAFSEVQQFLPTINGSVEALAGHLGRAFRTTTGGLLTGLEVMLPLLQDGGRYAEVLAEKFADFTASQDFKDFIDYARRELPNVGDALLSLASGFKDLGVALAPVGDDLIELIRVSGESASAISKVVGPIADVVHWVQVLNAKGPAWQSMLRGARDDNTSAAAAVGEHTSHLQLFSGAATSTAIALGTTDAALQAAQEGQSKHAAAAADATLQMQLEGDAAGLLKQQLDILNGKALDFTSAQTSAASATLRVNESLDKNGKSLSLNTEAGVKNRQAIEAKARADQALAEATGRATGSTEKGTASLAGSKKALEDNLRAHGQLTPAIQAYIDKIYKVPKVAPTKAEFDDKAARTAISNLQIAIDSLHGKSVTVGVHYAVSGRRPDGGRMTSGGITIDSGATGGLIDNGIRHFSGGGLLTGPGTGTSDSILAQIRQTGEMIRVANGEFISTAASQRRNRAALEAGNAGATLTAVGGAASEPIDYARLAAAMSRVTLRPVVNASQFDRALVDQL